MGPWCTYVLPGLNELTSGWINFYVVGVFRDKPDTQTIWLQTDFAFKLSWIEIPNSNDWYIKLMDLEWYMFNYFHIFAQDYYLCMIKILSWVDI